MRGGPRLGAGRRVGSKNKPKVAAPEVPLPKLRKGRITPLEYMLAIVADETADQARRDRMAIAAAPFVHPKLAVIPAPQDPPPNPAPRETDRPTWDALLQ